MDRYCLTVAKCARGEAPIQVEHVLGDGRVRHQRTWEVWIDGPCVIKAILCPNDKRADHVWLETATVPGAGGVEPLTEYPQDYAVTDYFAEV